MVGVGDLGYRGKPFAVERATTTAMPAGAVLLLEGTLKVSVPSCSSLLLRAKVATPSDGDDIATSFPFLEVSSGGVQGWWWCYADLVITVAD